MKLAQDIIAMIDGVKRVAIPVLPYSNLYTDIGLDSMTFIALLMDIEGKYTIQFDLEEMEECLHVARLVGLVRKKVKEVGYASGITGSAQQS